MADSRFLTGEDRIGVVDLCVDLCVDLHVDLHVDLRGDGASR